MRQLTNDNIYLNHYNNQSHKNDEGYYTEVLQSIENLFAAMTEKHNKVLFTRFDLTYPQCDDYPNNNVLLSRFMEAFNFYCKGKELDPHYLWVREQASSAHHHYHVIFLLNGNKIQNPYGIFNKATDRWGKCLNTDAAGLVHYGPYFMIRRNTPEFNKTLHDSLASASYLAKAYSKGNAPSGVRERGMSNIVKY